MKSRRRTLCQALAVGLMAGGLLASLALAHHGWGPYDPNKTLNLTGVIQEASYSNPHGLMRFQVAGANSKTWVAVLAPPSRMSSRGLSQEMLKVGATVTVVGYPHNAKADEMRVERITIEGKTVELR